MNKKLTGTVVSAKMDKTVVVEVSRLKQHPRYIKRYEVDKKFKAHDEEEQYEEGDEVVIEECRPISKDKKWRVIGKADSEA